MINKYLFYWVPVFLWCSFIFFLSSLPGLKTDLGAADFVLRKLAHIIEYIILFTLMVRAAANTFSCHRIVHVCIFAIIFSVLYAASDEYHQSFVPGRGPSVIDIGIDSFGVFIGYYIYMLRSKRRISGC